MKRQNWIMVVDDDLSVRQMVARVLTGEGYGVVSASNGEEALHIASCVRIDLVLLDLNLPVKSGWDIFEKLTTDNPLLPVIIITARSNQLFTALGAGVGGLFEKPLDFPTLLQTIKDLLQESREARLARVSGRQAPFHFTPAEHREQPQGM